MTQYVVGAGSTYDATWKLTEVILSMFSMAHELKLTS